MSKSRRLWEEEFDSTIAREPHLEENKLFVEGSVEEDFEYSHTSHGRDFYIARIAVERLSGIYDHIMVLASGEQLNDLQRDDLKGRRIQVAGKIVSRREDYLSELLVMAETINEEPLKECKNANILYLCGDLWKKPIFRTTPRGKDICEFCLRTEKGYGNFAYIHCIAWNNFAKYAKNLTIGNTVEVFGRMQSRMDKKRGEIREVNEVSIFYLERAAR